MKHISWALLAAAAILFWQVDGCYRERQGALRAENAMLKAQVAQVDTVYQTDTLTLTRWRTRYDSLRDTLLLTDTVAVKEFVLTADSTIKACTRVLLTCEERVRLRDLRYANLEKQQQDRFLGIRLPSRTTMFGLGILGGYLLAK